MKRFCETSSFFEVGNIKNEAILRDFLQEWKVECRADGLVPIRFAIFPVHLSKVLRLPRKSHARSYEVLHLSRKIISANLKIWCSKMQPLSGNQRPDLLTSLMNMSLVLRLPRKMHLYGSSALICYKTLTFYSLLTRCTIPCACHAEHTWTFKSGLNMSFFNILTWKYASRHNGVHFFDISTSRKLSDVGAFCAFWLGNVLCATTACIFSTSQLPKVVRRWCVLYILTWKCASRHNGVQFFISHLARWLRTRCFSEPTFRPSCARNHRKNRVIRDFSTFSRTCIFFLLTLSLLWYSCFFSSLLSLSLLILSDVWLLNFLR